MIPARACSPGVVSGLSSDQSPYLFDRRALLFACGAAVGLCFWGSLPGAAAEKAILIDVPFVRQVAAGCGSAAVAMVMQYWARQDSRLDALAAHAELIHKRLTPSGKGIAGSALKGYLEEHGFQTFLFDGELRDIRQHLEKGRPLIVCLGLGGPRASLHYAVVVGLEPGSVLLNDPARGKLVREDMKGFLRAWKATENWALLAVPRQAP